MTYSANNVLVGAADLYLSTASSTSATGWPAIVPAATAGHSVREALTAANSGWRHVGYTTEGLEISYEPDYGDVTVDQSLSSVKTFKQGITMSVNTTLAEATLENLLTAWAQDVASYKGATADADAYPWGAALEDADEAFGMDAGTLGDEPVERALIAVGLAPRGANNAKRERIYFARRVISVSTSSFSVRRTEATVFPVSFRLLPDGSVPRAQFGVIRDRTIGTVAP